MSSTALPQVTVRAPGKVNLFLHVGPLRPDGYHDLVTIFHAVDVADEVTARPAAAMRLTVSGANTQAVPLDRRNLAWQAAELLAQEFGSRAAVETLAVHLHIDKHIPVAGGMAGGSADAAAALVACARLWRIELTNDELHGLAARLGSDVNFCLIGGTALGRGRGEVLTPLTTSQRYHWVFATADGGIPAAAAYRELDRLRSVGAATAHNRAPELATLSEALTHGGFASAQALFSNDLEVAAISLRPQLQKTLDAGREQDAIGHVSGSGPTCAFLVADAAHASALAEHLRKSSACLDAFVATGPAPGPAPFQTSEVNAWQ